MAVYTGELDEAQLERDGCAIRLLDDGGQPWMTFYKPNGEAMRLPADPLSLQRYLRRGFTLTPPVVAAKKHGTRFACAVCEFGANSKTKLVAHMLAAHTNGG